LIFEKVFFLIFLQHIQAAGFVIILYLFFIPIYHFFVLFVSFFFQANTQTIFQSYRHHQHWIGSELNKRLNRYTHGIRIYFHIGLLCTYVWCVL